MNKDSKIYVVGHRGMVGSAIVRYLKSNGYKNLIGRTFSELDLRRQSDVEAFFTKEKPEYVILAAAKVGGIHANATYPAEFLYDNLMIETNVIHAAHLNKVKKLLFLGSSCIYPKMCDQPIKEEFLLTGPLETTNEAYAIAKISGIELCKFYRKQYGDDFISAMPTNLYGINDNFDLQNSHVLPALIRKFHEAKLNNDKKVVIWGTGKPRREFLFVDDLVTGLIHLLHNYSDISHVNIGTGEDITIMELAETIKEVIGYEGLIINDTSKPDGTPQKLLDVSLIHSTGWKHLVELKLGIQKVYDWYLTTLEKRR